MTQAAYFALAITLLTTNQNYLDKFGSRVFYPGRPSNHGRSIDGLEGFSRLAPVYAAWIASSQNDYLREDLLASDLLYRALRSGTDPASVGYWGDIGNNDQRIVEAADIALALWISRQEIPRQQQKQIATWLRQINGKKIPDNNWHLFVALTNAVLKSLGEEYDAQSYRDHYTRFKSFYRGQGWFSDGPQGPIDYYNPWGMQWALLWLDQIDPELDREFIRSVHQEFARTFIHFFTPNGFPIMGRSTCYRLALPAPLVLGRIFGINDLSDGQVKRTLNVTWQYFLRHGALVDGRVTQGYWRDDRRLLEHYSGPASCFWSVRSLVAALLAPASFWEAPEEALPVEKGDFSLDLMPIGWHLEGRKWDLEVILRQSQSQAIKRSDRRKYGLSRYSSRLPYFYNFW